METFERSDGFFSDQELDAMLSAVALGGIEAEAPAGNERPYDTTAPAPQSGLTADQLETIVNAIGNLKISPIVNITPEVVAHIVERREVKRVNRDQQGRIETVETRIISDE